MRYIKTLAGDIYPVHYSTGKELYEQLYSLPLEIKSVQQCSFFYDNKPYYPLAEEHPPEEAVIDLAVVPRYQLPDVSITAEEREYYTTQFPCERGKEYLVWIDNNYNNDMKGLCLFRFIDKNLLYHSYCFERKIPVSEEVQQRFEYLKTTGIFFKRLSLNSGK
jgi:hypothetical protein